MRINYDIFASILNTFLESPDAFISLEELNFYEAEGEEKDILIFHLLLLIENEFICNRKLETGDPACIGFVYTGKGIGGRNVPIMLTQDGHDFANALHQKPVLERLKKEFTEAPFELEKLKDMGGKVTFLAVSLKMNISLCMLCLNYVCLYYSF